MTARSLRDLLGRAVRALGSYGLSVTLFLLLMLLTFLGTQYQVEHGLYEAQRRYFESLLVLHYAFGIVPVPLPGACAAMALLFVNLLVGAVVTARKGWRKLGILTAHTGILLLLAGALVSHTFSTSGHMTLYEGESVDSFTSYHEWEVALRPAASETPMTEYIIPEREFSHAHDGRVRTFAAPGSPVELELSGYMRNARPIAAGPGVGGGVKVVDGFYLHELPTDRSPERNVPGVYATVRAVDGRSGESGILWGSARGPLTAAAGGGKWTVDLRRRTWLLPFSIRLDEFRRELYSSTTIPRAFMSTVTMSESGVQQRGQISMNAPLRRLGYTLYQSSWGPQDAGTNARLYSVLAVVRNPADQVPLLASIVVTLGLVSHYTVKLYAYLRKEGARSR